MRAASAAAATTGTALRRGLATPATNNDPFANGTNTYYAEEMYRHWREDPSSVHASWATYFSGLDKGLGGNAFTPPPRLVAPPADGAPALTGIGGDSELDIHLKVCTTKKAIILLLTCV